MIYKSRHDRGDFHVCTRKIIEGMYKDQTENDLKGCNLKMFLFSFERFDQSARHFLRIMFIIYYYNKWYISAIVDGIKNVNF